MKSMVLGLVALVSTGARSGSDLYRDGQARRAEERMVLPRLAAVEESGVEPTAVFTRKSDEAASRSDGSEAVGADPMGAISSEPPDWEVACQIKSGSALIFDRASLREYGAVTLFRWAAPGAQVPDASQRIYTGVADCREKTIEPSWPGRSRETRAGTCGRGLVEAVCAAAGQAAAPARGRPAAAASTARSRSAETTP
jgi:hypothetical protein